MLFVVGAILVAVAGMMAMASQSPAVSAQGTLPPTPTRTPAPVPTPFPTPSATPVVEEGAAQFYVTSQQPSIVIDPATDIEIEIPRRAVSGQAFVSIKRQAPETTPPLPTGARFSSAELVDLKFKDLNGDAFERISKSVKISFPFTLDEFTQAGVDGFQIYHYKVGNGGWLPLPTTVDIVNRRAYAYTNNFSAFGLATVNRVETSAGVGQPSAGAGSGQAQLPSVGGASPSGTLIATLLLGGVGMIAAGGILLKRWRRLAGYRLRPPP
ncbi:MAG: hypothetical protein L0177_17230 [Chloroflexi bacterium]|nr:hypothetical protein [Chloroflexota bacterium]